MSAESADLFKLPDFDFDDDEEDEDYEPKVQGRKKAVIEDEEEEEDDNSENGEDDDVDDDDDEDYEEEEDDYNGDDEEDDDEKITLQQEKVEQRRKKSVSKRTESDVIIAEIPKGTGQQCANMGQATEFRNYIKSVMKNFEERIKKGKQVKKYLIIIIIIIIIYLHIIYMSLVFIIYNNCDALIVSFYDMSVADEAQGPVPCGGSTAIHLILNSSNLVT